MSKKVNLGGFKLKLMPEVSNGLIIPVGNNFRPQDATNSEPIISSFVEPKPPPKQRISKPNIAENRNNYLGKIELDSSAFTPMTNVVPTIEGVAVPDEKPTFKGFTRRQKQRVTPEDMDLTEFTAQPTIGDKILYLSLRGWSLKVRPRGNGFYRFATKYVWKDRDGKPKLEKKSIYLGSVNRDLSESITIKSFSI